MKIKWSSIIVLLLLWFCTTGYSQETGNTLPLQQVLENITRSHGYRFNYPTATISGIEIIPPDAQWSIDKILAYLSEKTALLYSELPNNFIAIQRPVRTACGYIRDRNTDKTLPSATVQSSLGSAISDENGYFELDINAISDLISVRFIGYRNYDVPTEKSESGSCLNILLIPEQLELNAIVLYDYLIRGIDQLDDGSFLIDFDRFSILPGLIETDVLQAVQAFPGIQSVNETVSDINIRGGTNDQNLLLWDGIKMYQSGHFFGLISMFNPMITQKVALRKNGTPASMTDGVSGTISMETSNVINEQFSGSLGLNFIDVSGFADTPLGTNSSLQVAARKAINDFVESPTYTEYFTRISQDTEVENNTVNVVNSDKTFDFYDTSIRWLWQPSSRDRVRLNFIHARNELVFNENTDIANPPVTRESSLIQGTIAGGFNYQRQWSEKVHTEIDFYNTDYNLKAINANIEANQRFLQENKVSETAARITNTIPLNGHLHWKSGYQFTETKVTNLDDIDDPVFRRLEGNVLRVHSGYTSLRFSSENKTTSARLGLRFNYLDKFDRKLYEPRLSFNHRFAKWFNIEILGESKNQYTSQVINFQNDFLGIEKRRWQLSSEIDIPVITSNQVSAGMSFNKAGWLTNIVGFYKEVEGITAQSQGFQNQYEFTKAKGSYTAAGMDVLVRKQYKDIITWLSYSYLDAEYNFSELPENIFPSNYDITHTLTFGFTYQKDHLRLAAGWNWRTGKPTTRPDSDTPVLNNTVNFQPSNSERFQDYMRVDLSALYSFSAGRETKAQIGFSVWNLLNRENTVSRFYRPNGLDEANMFTQNSLGITPNAVFRLNF